MAIELRDTRRKVITRARALETAVAAWMRKYARLVLEEELTPTLIMKASRDEEQIAELLRLLRNFGLVQMDDAAGSVGADVLQQGQLVNDFLAGKEVMVQGISQNVREQVRRQIRDMVQYGLNEVPQPSVGELAKRIREYYRGTISGPAAAGARDWNDVSNARAALIARTEAVQAVNAGKAAGFEQLGIEFVKWLSFSDGKSGDRRHDLMNGKIVRLNDYFTTPLGNRLRWPGDTRATIKETANCRCSIRPATMADLIALSNAELADLGLTRQQLEGIQRAA